MFALSNSQTHGNVPLRLTPDNMEASTQENTVYAVLFGCIVALGLPLNAVSLWIFLRHHSLKSSNAVFMVNLAFSDLLLAISLPIRVYFYSMGTWTFGATTCTWIMILFHNNIRSSSIFLTFISVDRLLAVVYPLRSRHLRTWSNAWKSAAVVWLVLVAASIPEGMGILHLNRCRNFTCFDFPRCPTCNNSTGLDFSRCQQDDQQKSLKAHVVAGFLLALLAVNVVSIALVTWTLCRHLNDSAQVNNKVNIMLIYVLNLIMMIVCFLPLSLALLFKSWKPALKPLVCLASVNCCLDPLLYYFSLDAFWKKKKSSKNSADSL